MSKYCLDLSVVAVERLTPQHVRLRLTHSQPLPPMRAGQFVHLRIERSPQTFLRRPFSINFVDYSSNELWLLVHIVGAGSAAVAQLPPGATVSGLLPLGNGFTPAVAGERLLLVGGGVGIAPLLFLGAQARACGATPTFLLGAKTSGELLDVDRFRALGTVCLATDDGSAGEHVLVPDHSIFAQQQFDRIAACGPLPMMKGVARRAQDDNVCCEVSLENLMACGVGACLCCVERTTAGHRCVCTDGPVFNINQLLWHA